MPVTPTGPLAIATAKLRRMVAASPTFQAQTGAADATEAAQHVHLANVVGQPTRPHAVISMGEQFQFGLAGGGSFNHLRPSGSLWLYLARDTPPAYWQDSVQAEWDAWSFFGGVLLELAELSAKDDPASPDGESHLPIVRISVTLWGENDAQDWQSLGRFYFAVLLVDWGDGST